MKLYNVILDDGRAEEVVADSFMLVDGNYLFYTHGKPIPDIFFQGGSVKGINVILDRYEDGFRWRGGGSY